MDGDSECYSCNFNEDGKRTSEGRGFLSAVGGISCKPLVFSLFWEGLKFFRDLDSKLYSPEETVRRARSKLGESEYNLIFNNCEHFAIWCKTGVSKSEQVDEIIDFLIGGAVSARV